MRGLLLLPQFQTLLLLLLLLLLLPLFRPLLNPLTHQHSGAVGQGQGRGTAWELWKVHKWRFACSATRRKGAAAL
jgi:hypothetical protein